MNDSSFLTLGDKDSVEDSVTIKDNLTATGEPANLRLASTGLNNKPNSLLVLSELTGEIHVVNPGADNTQFGTKDEAIAVDVAEHIFSDLSNHETQKGRTDNKLFWKGVAVWKITNANRDLLHVSGKEAIYNTLTEAFQAFGSSSFDGTPANIEIFKPSMEEVGYTGKAVYMMEAGITVPGKTITVRTADPDATQYPYQGGEGYCTILRANTPRSASMFLLDNGACNLTFRDIIIDGQSSKSQFAAVNGGAAQLNKSGAKLTIAATAVVRNAESAANGGGVSLVNGAKLIMDVRTEEQGAAIVACKATNGGGVFDAASGTADVTDWKLFDCVASASGGGIYYQNAVTVNPGETTLLLKGCKANNGGGISGANTVTLMGSMLFDSCQADNQGGGICLFRILTANNHPVFVNCKAGNNGGGIALPSEHNFCRHSITGGASFTNCKATNGNGGGLYCYSDDNNSWGRGLTLGGTINLTGCTAGKSGGGIYKGLGNANYGYLTFNANSAIIAKNCHALANDGGGLYTGCLVKIGEGTSFQFGGEEDDDPCTAKGSGGGWYGINESMTATDQGITMTATNCSAGINGGGIHTPNLNASGAEITLTNCTAKGSGGGLYSGGILTAGKVFRATGCEAGGSGGGACIYQTMTANYNIVFLNCKAGSHGGGLALPRQHNFYRHSITDGAVFTNCTATTGDGGGLYCYSDDDNSWGRGLTLNGTFTFTNCSAGTSGGGMYKGKGNASYGYLTVNPNSILKAENCHAGSGNGGGIYTDCLVHLKQGVQVLAGGEEEGKKCTAGGNGGGFYNGAQGINATEQDIILSVVKCTAGGSGGGAYVSFLNAGGASVTISDCTAHANGGGLYATAYVTTGEVFRITRCTAETGAGGGALVYQTLTADHNPVFLDCAAGTHGGGLALPSQHNFYRHSISDGAVFTNCTTSTGDGGGLYCYSDDDNSWGRGLIMGGEFTFTNCSAGRSGGGMYKGVGNANYGYLELKANTKITAKNCHANSGSGGALFTQCILKIGKGVALLMGGAEEGEGCSSGGNGGGLYANQPIDITAGDITLLASHCQAKTGSGGGVWTNGSFTATNDTCSIRLEDCSAGGNGGGLYANGAVNIPYKAAAKGALEDYHCEITGCTAHSNGGGIYIAGEERSTSVLGGVNESPIVIKDCTAAQGAAVYVTKARYNDYIRSLSLLGGFDSVQSGASPASADDGEDEERDTSYIPEEICVGIIFTGNTATDASGACVNFGGLSNRLYLEGNILINNNQDATGREARNVALSQDSYGIIIVKSSGIGKHSSIGVYTTAGNPDKNHGFQEQNFATLEKTSFTEAEVEMLHTTMKCFVNDRRNLTGTPNLDGSNHLVRWSTGYVCKLTDENGKLLYRDRFAATPAVYSSLKSGMQAATGKLYTRSRKEYENNEPIQLKLLTDVVLGKDKNNANETATFSGAERDLTITTAEPVDEAIDAYPYSSSREDHGNRAMISTNSEKKLTNSMFVIKNNNTYRVLDHVEDVYVYQKDENGEYVLDENGEKIVERIDKKEVYRDETRINKVTVSKLLLDGTNQSYTKNGGAILLNAAKELALEDVTFQNFTAANGGAIYIENDIEMKTASNVKFSKCTATAGGGNPGLNGGGGINANHNLKLTNSGTLTFDNCTASNGQGGGMNVYGIAANNSSFKYREEYPEIINTGTITFNECSSKADAGALGVQENHLTIDNSCSISFTDCVVNTQEGGAINIDGGKLTVKSTPDAALTFRNCICASASNGVGGGVYAGSMDTSKNQGTISFEGCKSGKEGGAIYLAGSAVSGANGNSILRRVSIDGGKDNNASKGGAIYLGNHELTIVGGEIKRCTASNANGGAINVSNGAKLYFSGDAVIYDNLSGGVQKNVVLEQNSNGVINTLSGGLSEEALIGIYLVGEDNTSSVYGKHGKYLQDFGTYALAGSDENGNAAPDGTAWVRGFVNDRNGLYGEVCPVKDEKVDHTATGLHLIRWQSYLCKLTDDQGKLLYTDEKGRKPAVYDTLTEAFNAAKGRKANGTDALTLYSAYGEQYTYDVGNAIKIELLKNYTQPGTDRPVFDVNRVVTLTTASTSTTPEDVYIFNPADNAAGESKTKATVTRGENGKDKDGNDIEDASMLTLTTGAKELILTNVIFDGNGEEHQPEVNGGIVNIAKGTLSLADGAVLQNSIVSRHLYKLRCNIAHLRYDQKEVNDVDWRQCMEMVVDIIYAIYSKIDSKII